MTSKKAKNPPPYPSVYSGFTTTTLPHQDGNPLISSQKTTCCVNPLGAIYPPWVVNKSSPQSNNQPPKLPPLNLSRGPIHPQRDRNLKRLSREPLARNPRRPPLIRAQLL